MCRGGGGDKVLLEAKPRDSPWCVESRKSTLSKSKQFAQLSFVRARERNKVLSTFQLKQITKMNFAWSEHCFQRAEFKKNKMTKYYVVSVFRYPLSIKTASKNLTHDSYSNLQSFNVLSLRSISSSYSMKH